MLFHTKCVGLNGSLFIGKTRKIKYILRITVTLSYLVLKEKKKPWRKLYCHKCSKCWR